MELPLTKQKEGPVQASLDLSGVNETLLAELTRRGVMEKKARELLSQLAPGQQVQEQLEYLDSVIDQAPQGRFHNPPGLYIRVVQQNGPVPESFLSSRKRQLLDETKQKQHAHLTQQAQLEAEYDNYRQRESERFLADAITPEEYQLMFEDHRSENRRVFPRLSTQELDQLSRAAVILELRENDRIPLLSLEEFQRKQGLVASKRKKR